MLSDSRGKSASRSDCPYRSSTRRSRFSLRIVGISRGCGCGSGGVGLQNAVCGNRRIGMSRARLCPRNLPRTVGLSTQGYYPSSAGRELPDDFTALENQHVPRIRIRIFEKQQTLRAQASSRRCSRRQTLFRETGTRKSVHARRQCHHNRRPALRQRCQRWRRGTRRLLAAHPDSFSRKTLRESGVPHIIAISGGSLCCAAKDSGG